MAALQELNQFRSLDPSVQSFVLAISVVAERIRRLSEAELADLWTLVKEFGQAKDPADQEGALRTMLEIIDGSNEDIVQLPLADSGTESAEVEKWRAWVGGRVRAARTEANLTQEELAARSGLPQSHISRIENGRLSPSRTTLEKVAGAVGKPISHFDHN